MTTTTDPPQATAALAAIRAVAVKHTGGHRCSDGKWYNDQTGTRTPCDISLHLTLATGQVARLAGLVRTAAVDGRHIDAVAEGMTGLVLTELAAEDAAGWRQTAAYAITALADSLDRAAEPLPVACPRCDAPAGVLCHHNNEN